MRLGEDRTGAERALRRALRLVVGGAVALASVAFGLAAGGAGAAEVVVTLSAGLQPQSLTVAPGTLVTFRNDDGARHRMRTTAGPVEIDTGDLDPGDSASVTLVVEGTYTYRDERNRDDARYRGTITVTQQAPPTSTPGTTLPPPSTATVRMAGRVFTPAALTVATGGSVSFVNDDRDAHTATASGQWDSGFLQPGASWVKTFTSAGSFRYICVIHPDMVGTITVVTPGSPPPPPPPPPPPATTSPPVPPPPTSAPSGPGTSAATVTMGSRTFTPVQLRVDPGTTVTWVGTDTEPHTVTATGQFDSGIVAPGGTYRHTFPTNGTYAYVCLIHPGMQGTVVVAPAGAPEPPAPPPTGAPASPAVGVGTVGGAAPPAASSRRHEVAVLDLRFDPQRLTVSAGDSVTWVNKGVALHTVTAGDKTFDSGLLAAGAAYALTFTRVGAVPYVCTLHPGMTGTVIVEPPAPGTSVVATDPAPVPGSSPPTGGAPTGDADKSPSTTAGGRPAQTVDVSAVDNSFTPNGVTVSKGDSVRWNMKGRAPHTVTARDGTFDSGLLQPGEVFEQTFATAGTFAYVCSVHPDMAGYVEVVEPEVAGEDKPAGPQARVLVPPSAAGAGPDSLQVGLLGAAGILAASAALVLALRRFLLEVH
ncbi:MAG TPA: cupredoxin domain-containing protein [Acidimicrobiales bacterium]